MTLLGSKAEESHTAGTSCIAIVCAASFWRVIAIWMSAAVLPFSSIVGVHVRVLPICYQMLMCDK